MPPSLCRALPSPFSTHRARGDFRGAYLQPLQLVSCPQDPELSGELGPGVLELVPCGPFLYPGLFSLSLCPHLFSPYIYAQATGGPGLMDNLEPPPTHPVTAPPLGSCPPGLSSSPLRCHLSRGLYAQSLSLRDNPIRPLFKGEVAEGSSPSPGTLWQGVIAGLSPRVRRAQAGPLKGGYVRMEVP